MASVTRPASTSTDVRLDDVSKAIIEQLQEDGRQSYADHRQGASGCPRRRCASGCSGSSTPEVMQIVAVTDPLQVGFHRQAMIGIRVDGDLDAGRRRADRHVGGRPTSSRRPGRFDLLAEVVCEDDADLLDLLTRRIRTLPGVQTTETFVYLKLNKQHYNWGTR